MRNFVSLALLACILVGTNNVQAGNFFDIPQFFRTSVKGGHATWYGEGGQLAGACGLGPVWSQLDIPKLTAFPIAIAGAQYYNSGACGTCVKVTPKKSMTRGATPFPKPVIAYVADLCGCGGPGGIDIFKNGDGKWDIDIIAVPCPISGSTKIKLKFQGGDGWNFKFQLLDSRVPITLVETSQKKNGQHVSWAKWKKSTGSWNMDFSSKFIKPMKSPFDFRLTTSEGKKITIKGVQVTNFQALVRTRSQV